MTTNKKLQALVIEDNIDNMKLITLLLHKGGFESVWANTGYMGVRMAEEKNPDFILLDIQLPDINGYEVLDRIRTLDSNINKVPIIAMTSYAMSGDRQKLLSAGCNGYIEKPIDPMRVIDQIKRIIENENKSTHC